MSRIWDLKMRNLSCQRIFQANAPVNCAVLHPNQQELVVGDQSGVIHIWNLQNDQSEQLIPEQDASIQHIDIDKQGRYMVRGTAITRQRPFLLTLSLVSRRLSTTRATVTSGRCRPPALKSPPLCSPKNGSARTSDTFSAANSVRTEPFWRLLQPTIPSGCGPRMTSLKYRWNKF